MEFAYQRSISRSLCLLVILLATVVALLLAVGDSAVVAGASTRTERDAPQPPRTYFTVSGHEHTVPRAVWAAHERRLKKLWAWAQRMHYLSNPPLNRRRRVPRSKRAFGRRSRASVSSGQALILASTVTAGLATDGSGTSVEQQEAAADGFSVTVVTDAQWAAMTTAQFRAYRVLIIGDPECGDSVDTSTVAEQSAATWEPAVMDSGGNKVLIGTDPVYHFNNGSALHGDVLIRNGIGYAGAVSGATGLYMDLSCTYNNAEPGTAVPILDGLSTHGAGQFTVVGQGPLEACATSVNIVANTGPTTGLTDADLSVWNCSVHEAFDRFPTDYTPLSIAPSSSGFPISYCGTDVETRATVCGSPYILVSGSGVISGGPTLAEQGGPPPPSEHPTTCSTGRPVNCATGTFWHTFQDIAVPGNGVPLAFARTYSSAAASTNGPLGFGWTDNYDMHLSFDGSGDGTVTEANGSQVTFVPTGSGGFAAPARVLATLVANGDGTYTYSRFADHVQYILGRAGQLLKEIDRNGYTTTLTYGGGQLTSVTDPSGRSLTLRYSGSQITSVTDPAGRVWSYGYDGSGNLVKATDPLDRALRFTYDPNHLLLSMTDPRGGTTTNTYDGSNRVTRQVDPAGRATTWTYSGDPASTTGSTTTITDPKGNVTVEKYENLQLLSITRGAGTPQAGTTNYQYDPNTLGISRVTDPNGNVTTNTYDSHGNLLTTTDPLGNKTTYSSNGFDEPTAETDPLGTPTISTYDANGNLLSSSTPVTGGGTATTTYKYGSGATAGDVISETDPDGHLWTFQYDSAGDLAGVTDPAGDRTSYRFDLLGRRIAATTPAGHTTTYRYDAVGELVETTDPLRHATRYSYDSDGNQITVVGPRGDRTTYTYDGDNEETAVHRANGTTERTTYYPDRTVEAQSDGAGHVTRYTYDPLGRVATVTDPLGRSTQYRYDGDGNTTSIIDPQSRITRSLYNADNELTSISYSDRRTPDVTNITYDAAGQRTAQTDGSGRWSWTWDSLHRLTSVAEGTSGTVRYQYNLRNEPTQITYPDGDVVTRGYDAAGRWTNVRDWLGNTTTFRYDRDGNLIIEILPRRTRIIDRSTYAADDTLRSIRDTRGAKRLFSANYARDANQQLTGDSSEPATSRSYAYTLLNQLCEAERRHTSCAPRPSGAILYRYDRADNLTHNGGTTQAFNRADELTRKTTIKPGLRRVAETLTFRYDREGDRTRVTEGRRRVTVTYGYNQALELTVIGRRVAYTYNGDGLRVSTTAGGRRHHFAWDLAGAFPTLIGDGSHAVIYGPAGLPLEQINHGTVLWFHHDQLGSTRVLTDRKGHSVATYSYTPYGSVLRTSGRASTPLLFGGQYLDSESGMYYLHARYYDPSTAQFLTIDPERAITRSAYGYVLDNPLNASDPSGLGCGFLGLGCAVQAVGSVAGTVAGGVVHVVTSPAFLGGVAVVGGIAVAATGVGAIAEASVAAGAEISLDAATAAAEVASTNAEADAATTAWLAAKEAQTTAGSGESLLSLIGRSASVTAAAADTPRCVSDPSLSTCGAVALGLLGYSASGIAELTSGALGDLFDGASIGLGGSAALWDVLDFPTSLFAACG